MLTYKNLFPDARLSDRADRIAAAMAERQSVVIRRLTDDHAEAAGAYRFFGNESVSLDALEAALLRHCRSLTDGGHKLVIQDTTQLNFDHLAERLGASHGLGVIGDNASLGCFLHPSLVVDAAPQQTNAQQTNAQQTDAQQTVIQQCHGLSDVRLWTRPDVRPDKHERQYQKQPIEEKESFRWIESVAASEAVLDGADLLTMVADREADIFEVFARVPGGRTNLLVRAARNRRISEPAGMLYEHINKQAVAGCYSIEVRGDKRRNRTARTALLEVRFARIHLRRPHRLRQTDAPKEVALYVVEAKEAAATVPEGEDPIHWRLLTSHRVEDVAMARQIITWYRQRWHIEQYFRLLKSKGLNLEGALLEDGQALQRLCLMALGAALEVMRLLLAREGTKADTKADTGATPVDEPATAPVDEPATAPVDEPVAREKPLAGQVFAPDEQACIEALMPRWEGQTQKQRNSHAAGTLAWASWLIARLGGWKGYASQRPPGPITYYRGMYRFAQIYQGWKLAHP